VTRPKTAWPLSQFAAQGNLKWRNTHPIDEHQDAIQVIGLSCRAAWANNLSAFKFDGITVQIVRNSTLIVKRTRNCGDFPGKTQAPSLPEPPSPPLAKLPSFDVRVHQMEWWCMCALDQLPAKLDPHPAGRDSASLMTIAC